MRWNERQLAMLREMGIRVWAPASSASADGAGGEATLVAEPPASPVAAATAATAASSVAAPVMRAVAPPVRDAEGAPPHAPSLRDDAVAGMPALASAHWLVVGEPFDAAGDAAADQEQLLDNMLRSIGVSRRAEAREGRAAHLALDAGGGGDIDAALATVQPRGILALGRGAALALLGVDEPLGKLRERVHERAGIPVVVTFALPYLLRHAEDKPRAWTDLCRAVAAVG